MRLPKSNIDRLMLRSCVGLIHSYESVSDRLGEIMRDEVREIITEGGSLYDWFYNRDTEFRDIFGRLDELK